MSFENTSYVLNGATIAAGGQSVQAGGQTITAGGQSITAGGQTITAGGQTITAGGQSITAGGQTITAGGQSITAGGATVTGGATVDMLKGGATAVTCSTGGSLATSGVRLIKATVSGGAQATNLTLASGLVGQEVVVINENAAGSSTLIITGSVGGASGTTSFTISGLAGKKFIWDDTQSLWAGL